jgi:hypothetical protein
MDIENLQKKYKTQGLQLIRLKVPGGEVYTSRFGDQYGRILEEYTNSKGEPDLRPVGLYTEQERA